MLGGPGFDSVVSVSSCQDGKWPPAATLLIIHRTKAESSKPSPSLLSLAKFKIPVSVAGGLSLPGLCSGHC